MLEMYWLTRLDGLCNFFEAGLVLGIMATIVSFFVTVIADSRNTQQTAVKYLKIFASVSIISGFVGIFVPNTKEAFLIYGVGNTIDYIKSNDKVQGLPDKCIDYLDAWVEQVTKEKQQKQNPQ